MTELKQLYTAIAAAFCFCESARIFWQTRNNNESTKCIILLMPRKFQKEFLKYHVNAFTAKKICVIASAILLLKNSDASVLQEAEQQNCIYM